MTDEPAWDYALSGLHPPPAAGRKREFRRLLRKALTELTARQIMQPHPETRALINEIKAALK